MTHIPQHNLSIQVGATDRGRASAGTFSRTAWSQPRTDRQENLSLATGWGSLAGYLLTWTAAVAFGSGLVGLAVSPLFEVTVPRWLILAHGIDCILVTLLALLLNRKSF
jgi:hypothetical protein